MHLVELQELICLVLSKSLGHESCQLPLLLARKRGMAGPTFAVPLLLVLFKACLATPNRLACGLGIILNKERSSVSQRISVMIQASALIGWLGSHLQVGGEWFRCNEPGIVGLVIGLRFTQSCMLLYYCRGEEDGCCHCDSCIELLFTFWCLSDMR